MNRNMKLALYLPLLLLLGSGVIWINAKSSVQGYSKTGSEDRNQGNSPLARLNEKAQAAQDGDASAVREMVDEVFRAGPFEQMPAGTLDAVKERLVRAEINYRNGWQKGIPERNVVMAINGLADKFAAPDYATTTDYEVRKLRAAALPLLPNLIARERPEAAKLPKPIGESINPEMSPVEAACVMLLMLQQKQTNPEYQLTFDERLAQWAEKYHGKPNPSNREADQAERNGDTPRQKEMQQVLERAASQIPVGDLLNIPSRALDILGINK